MISKNCDRRNNPQRWSPQRKQVVSPVPCWRCGLRRCGLYALTSTILFFALVSPARAALDLNLNTPYKIDVVLHISEHRVFTTTFRAQVRKQIRDLLELEFGQLATVAVSDQHPRLPIVVAKGLRQGLDEYHDHGDTQTHFVLLTYRQGQYQIASRLHDGATGLNAPSVQRAETSDRRQVGQFIANLVHRHFAPVGSIVEAGRNLRMAFQGGAFETEIVERVRPGDIFAVVRMRNTGTSLTGRKMEWALIQVIETPKNGWSRCRYYHRFPDDQLTIGGTTEGYRCLRLPAVKSPMRLKLIHADTFEPLSGWEVHIREPGSKNKARQLTTDSSGVAQTAQRFSGMVIADVVKGKSIWARLPIELTSKRIVVCRVKPVEGAEALALWEVRRDGWVNRIYDRLYSAGEQLTELNRRVPVSLRSAAEMAAEGSKSLAADIFTFTAQRDRLAEIARTQKLQITPSEFEEGNQRLQDLEERKKLFERLASKLALAVQQSAENKELSKEIVKAKLLENQGLVDQAISIYQRVLKKAPKRAAKVRIHLKMLRKQWSIQSPQHRKARDFIYRDWPHLKVDELLEKLPLAKNAYAVCKTAGDRFALRKMEIINLAHAVQLKKHLDALKQKDTPDNRAKAKIIAALASEFRRMHTELREMPKKN